MGMCKYCGGWDCVLCNPHDLIAEAYAARAAGTEKEWVAELIRLYEEGNKK